MESFLDTWSTSPVGEISDFLLAGFLFAAVLGWLSYTDLFRDKSVPNTGSIGLLFVSLALFPFIYQDKSEHIVWALALSVFFVVVFLVGAVADGDLKLYLAFAWILGPASLLAALISWIIVFIYSLPLIYQTLRDKGEKKKGERLGVAPAVPGIALAFPLTLALLGLDIYYVAAFVLVLLLSSLLSHILYRFADKAASLEMTSEEE